MKTLSEADPQREEPWECMPKHSWAQLGFQSLSSQGLSSPRTLDSL